jgi:hypothetical protein
LDQFNEVSLKEVPGHQIGRFFRLIIFGNSAKLSIGKLSRGVIPPNDNILDLAHLSPTLLSNQSSGSVLIQSGQSCDVFLGNSLANVGKDVGISVGWISHYQNFAALLGKPVEVLGMFFENLSVFSQKVFSFHSFGSGLGTDQDGNVAVLEGNCLITSDNDRVEQRTGRVVQFTLDSLQFL